MNFRGPTLLGHNLLPVCFHMLGEFAKLEELLATLVAGVDIGGGVAGAGGIRVCPCPVPGQPPLGGEGLEAAGRVAVEHGKAVGAGS